MQMCDMDTVMDTYPVLLDGCVIGKLRSQIAEEVCKKLRVFKASNKEKVFTVSAFLLLYTLSLLMFKR